MTAVADPLGGSWYVEALTRELEEKAWALIEEVEAHGGMTKAVAEGLPKQRIEEAAAARAAKVDTGETVIVGVNRYRLAEEEEHRHPRGRQCQGPRRPDRADREGARRPRRGEGAGGAGCAGSRRARRRESARPWRRGGPRALHARRDFGRAGARVRPLRDHARAGARHLRQGAAATRAGRRREEGTRSVADRLGRKPRILVAKMGQDGHDRGANLVSSAFADLGFEVIPGPLFQTPRETAQMAVENDVDVVGASARSPRATRR